MTAEDKTRLAALLDTAGDFLRDGHWRERETPVFEDDVTVDNAAQTIAGDGGGDSLEAAAAIAAIAAIAAEVRECRACGLCDLRILPVPGEGVQRPLVLVVGEAPGSEEDERGKPFVGVAGHLLDRMLASINLSRETNCFITNTVKCRPPGNRDPSPEETEACASFLARQIRVLRPAYILCMGRIAAQTMLRTSEGIGRLRGTFFDYTPDSAAGAPAIPLIATYHPSALLRDANLKRPAWEDLKKLLARLQT
ncbi:MAG: uracil-DNA glycosylase [Treponema sp.]|jgi:DNA polymerase|nr:uracil-DNA glycosylase [Treponema sp.]